MHSYLNLPIYNTVNIFTALILTPDSRKKKKKGSGSTSGLGAIEWWVWLIIIGVILLICILIALNSNAKNKQKEFRAEEARKVEEGKQESSNDETQGPVQDRDGKESGRYWSPGGE